MNEIRKLLAAVTGGNNAGLGKALMAPVFIVMVLSMMVLPLPSFALDLLFTFNIAMSLMVMMVSANLVRPLDFAAFPSVLLVTTLLRLSLNVASTRVVLLEGHTRPGAAGRGGGRPPPLSLTPAAPRRAAAPASCRAACPRPASGPRPPAPGGSGGGRGGKARARPPRRRAPA